MKLAFHAAWVFPVSSPPIRNGFVAIEHDRVVEVGDRAPGGAKIVDLGQAALLPRPVNAHTHLEFSDLTTPLGAPRQSFSDWIGEVLAERSARTTPKGESIGTGMQELRDSMTIGIGEIATLPSSAADYADAATLGVAFHEIL